MTEATGPKVRMVKDVMSSPAVTAMTSETIAMASTRMADHLVGSVVVVDGQRPVGILTERDLVRFAATGGDASTTKVSEWMPENPSTIGPSVEVKEAWKQLPEKHYRHIPVTSGTGELLGIVSMRDLMRVAQLQPLPGSAIEVPQGLKGVVVTETEVGDVRGYEGFYHYRQYSAIDLAETRTLECVWHLLFEGELPTADQRARFVDEVAPLRVIPDSVRPLLPAIAEASPLPLDGLRSAVSLIASASGFEPNIDIDRATLRANAMQIAAVVPTILTALHR